MQHSYSVKLTKENFTFCGAHFITYGGNNCEPLHGHNYRVSAELSGSLNENRYVVDFIKASKALAAITEALDHRVLLPANHPTIQVVEDGREVTATFEERRWVFPRGDCILLPIENTTAELLAWHIGEQLLASLAELDFRPTALVVAVDECQGQQGVCHWTV